jgi:hypothetical protein
MVAGEEPVGNPLGVSRGTGTIWIERNLIQGNVSNDDGGGIRLLTPVQGSVRILNNMIVDNLATDTGGGISLDDALDVWIINNTVIRNVSTATAEDADRTSCNPPPNGTCPHGAGLVSERHSQALLRAFPDLPTTFSDPVLFNNIFWRNEAFYLDGTTGLFGGGLPSAGYWDLEVLDPGQAFTQSRYNLCTTLGLNCPNEGTNLTADPMVVQEVLLNFAALAFAGDPSFITVLIRSTPTDPQGDYHLRPVSPAVDRGTLALNNVPAPTVDFDGQLRLSCMPDLGADEVIRNCMHVHDLDGQSWIIGSNRWRARVRITIRGPNEEPVPNATVTGAWSAGNSVGQITTCITDSNGRCNLTSGRLSLTNNPTVTFTVTAVTHPVMQYAPFLNHDPDGDSNGTTIVISRP